MSLSQIVLTERRRSVNIGTVFHTKQSSVKIRETVSLGKQQANISRLGKLESSTHFFPELVERELFELIPLLKVFIVQYFKDL